MSRPVVVAPSTGRAPLELPVLELDVAPVAPR